LVRDPKANACAHLGTPRTGRPTHLEKGLPTACDGFKGKGETGGQKGAEDGLGFDPSSRNHRHRFRKARYEEGPKEKKRREPGDSERESVEREGEKFLVVVK